MAFQWILVLFGIVFTLVGVLAIMLPFMAGRSHLLTGWNLFLLGSINFIGIASIQSGLAWAHRYVVPDQLMYIRFVAGAITFYAVAFLVYYLFPLPRRLAAIPLKKVAISTTPCAVFLAMLCLVLSMLRFFYPNIQFVGQILIFIGINAGVFAVVFLFAAWRRQPWNVLLLMTLVFAFILAAVVSLGGFGRRDFLALLMTIPICFYWLRLRYLPPLRTLVIASVFAGVCLLGLAGISVARHATQSPDESPLDFAMTKLRELPAAFSGEAAQRIIGGDTTECSLAAIHLYTKERPAEPFFVVRYLLVHPIPRAWYPEKPVALGRMLVEHLLIANVAENFTLGPGIVGHGYHEGGLLMLIFYAVLIASGFRLLDQMLVTRFENPFLLGIFSSISGQLIAFSRGDIGIFIVSIAAGILTGILLNWIGRAIFGTSVDVPQSTEGYGEALPPESDFAGDPVLR
jgi:hypothetical protein